MSCYDWWSEVRVMIINIIWSHVFPYIFFNPFFYLRKNFSFFHLWNILYNCKQRGRRGNRHFDVHLWRIRTVHFLSKDGKGACYEGREGWKGCLFPARVGTLTFDVILVDNTFPYLYFDLACKQLCFPPGKSKNRRNESTTSELYGNLTELYRTFESHSSELLIILQELFRTFSKTLSNGIEPFSERVYNCFWLINTDDI